VTSRLSQSLARGALALAVLGPVAWPAQDAPLSAPAGDAFALEVVPFIARYCSECHADPDGDPGLVLTKVTRGADARAAAETWEDVLAVLDLYDMPPREARQPNAHERAQIVSVLEDILALDPAPEYPGLRRLNAAEYTRTVRDLLGVEFDARAHFPPDGIGHGFDTVAAGLTLSDLAVELYLSTAETLAAEAVAVDHSASPGRTRLAGKQLSGAGRSGAKVLNTNGAIMGTFEVPRAGRYRLGSAAAATQAGTELARMGFSVDGRHLGEFDVQATPARARAGHPEEHFVECQLEAGSHRVGAHFLNDYYVPDHPDPTRRDRNLYVLWIELEGPLDAPPLTPFQLALAQRVGPDGLPESEAGRLAHLVHRIWRRPARAEDIERLLALPAPEAAADERLRIQLTALLASPHFLFRLEPAPPGAESGELRALGGSELASRLSYFLWGTTPDEELQLAASRGELSETVGYRRWVARLLDDPRSLAFSQSFSTQWLQLGGLQVEVQAGAGAGQEGQGAGDSALRQVMAAESVAFFDAVLREGLSLWQLLEADWTQANGALGELYGLEGVEGGGLRRVSLASTERRGVLGQAAVLTMTSESTRTSPVRRGKWVLEALLGAAPSAAPALPNPLAEPDPALATLSLRERWAVHREDSACALCHDSMDPIGFGLENYGPLGRWRDSYPASSAPDGVAEPVDGSGELPGGRRFDGPLGLVRALRGDDRFRETLTEKLLVYALGRGLSAADRSLVESIGAALQGDEPTLRQLVIEIACCQAFTHRRVGDVR
jgi:hypothetical protein